MKFLRKFLVCILLISTLPCFAQALWKDSLYGMSEEQVLKVNPSAMKPAQSSKLGDGATELLETQGIEIAKTKFTARFYFKESKLKQVTLGIEDGPTANQAALIWDEVYIGLSSKYGKEISRIEKSGILHSKDATWISGKTNISLLFMSVGNGKPILNIVYQQRISADASEL